MNSNYKKKNLGLQIRSIMMPALLLFPIINFGQQETKRHYVALNKTMKANSSVTRNTMQQITETIGEKDATWLRLFFKDVELGKNSTVTITSKLDGESQTLDNERIKEWNNSSAYFNGNEITVTLNVAPMENSSLKISEFSAGEVDSERNTQCGDTDDRVRSNDKRVGRIVPVGCSTYILRNGRLVTSGHCVITNLAEIIEFNVPISNANGSLNHPPVRDQYPITSTFTKFVRNQFDTDWAVIRAGRNTQTRLTPIQGQGRSFNVTRNRPGNNIRVTGFGTDLGKDNHVQQTHAGPLTSANNDRVSYRVDVTQGTSGGPIIDTATGNVVGVNSYGACKLAGFNANFGPRNTTAGFWAAMGFGNSNGNNTPTGPIVRFVKRNASNFAIDGNNGGGNEQNVYLWGNNSSNPNQQWIEVSIDGYFAYVKKDTQFALDGGNGGGDGQNVYLWKFDRTNENQHFRKVNVGAGHFRLEKRNAPGFSLDGGNGGRDGQNVYLWSSSNTNENQHFRIETVRASAAQATSVDNSGTEPLDVSVYPNPIKDTFSIKIGETVENATATIFNILGQKKSSFNLKKGINTHNKNDLGLKSGMYLIKIQTNKETTTKKIVVE